MKIKVNLLNEEESILQNNGYYIKVFALTDHVKRNCSKLGVAQMIINPGKFFGVKGVFLNDSNIAFDQPKIGVMNVHWNVPIKIKFDENLLNIDSYNKLELRLENKMMVTPAGV